jgi:hypothetical protein
VKNRKEARYSRYDTFRKTVDFARRLCTLKGCRISTVIIKRITYPIRKKVWNIP